MSFSEIVDALDAHAQAGAVQALLTELCAADVVERRGTGRALRKRYSYRVANVDAARQYLGLQRPPAPPRLRRSQIARAMKDERERVNEWFAALTWDAPAREAFMAYYRGDLSFAQLAQLLEREGFPQTRARRSAR